MSALENKDSKQEDEGNNVNGTVLLLGMNEWIFCMLDFLIGMLDFLISERFGLQCYFVSHHPFCLHLNIKRFIMM